MRQERVPVPVAVERQSLRRDAGRVQANLCEARLAECFLVGREAEVVILDGERTILEEERPGDRRAFHERSVEGRLEPVAAIRWSLIRIEHGVRINGDEAAPRLEAA